VSDVAIRVEHLSKQYRIGKKQERYYTLRDTIADAFTAPLRWVRSRRNGGSPNGGEEDTIWALKDVSFEVKHGEVVGIIGRNGAGKSTLLKILSRITEPTEGRVEIHGRVASLLEVGTGFHPELTGRENIYLNGAILGMSKAEIDRKFDEIVEFAEIEKFIDTPVKRYSSGMYMRLAFAVAAHLEPEILLVDEVLAVGDAAFQKKCLGKMGDVAKAGRTVLFVSHNMAAVEGLCEKGLLLSEGRLVCFGNVSSVVSRYAATDAVSTGVVDLRNHPGRRPRHVQLLDELRFLNEDGVSTGVIRMGERLRIQLVLNGSQELASPYVVIGFHNSFGQRIFSVSNKFGFGVIPPIVGRTVVECEIPSIRLMPGRYSIMVSIGSMRDVDRVDDAAWFDVVPADLFGTGRIPASVQGVVVQESVWGVVG